MAIDPRMHAAWREWLGALATDAEAAVAASHVYGDLTPEARDAWLDALGEDEARLDVPRIAIYAPLLLVESDPARRQRIEAAIGGDLEQPPSLRDVRAYLGISDAGERVVALVSPLYLRFVRVLFCRYDADAGFDWVRHEPLILDDDAPRDGAVIDGVALEATPLKPVIEELAHAVLAHGRRGLELPGPLRSFAHLFDARVDEDDDEPLP